MKWDCNTDESNELCEIINKFISSTYIKVNYISLTKKTISRRLNLGDPMVQIESKCVGINGSDIIGYDTITNGTRYVYEGERLYDQVFIWYNNRLQKIREEKLNQLGI